MQQLPTDAEPEGNVRYFLQADLHWRANMSRARGTGWELTSRCSLRPGMMRASSHSNMRRFCLRPAKPGKKSSRMLTQRSLMSRASSLKAGSSGRYMRAMPAMNAMPWQYPTCGKEADSALAWQPNERHHMVPTLVIQAVTVQAPVRAVSLYFGRAAMACQQETGRADVAKANCRISWRAPPLSHAVSAP